MLKIVLWCRIGCGSRCFHWCSCVTFILFRTLQWRVFTYAKRIFAPDMERDRKRERKWAKLQMKNNKWVVQIEYAYFSLKISPKRTKILLFLLNDFNLSDAANIWIVKSGITAVLCLCNTTYSMLSFYRFGLSIVA